jgi:hypothetical protein
MSNASGACLRSPKSKCYPVPTRPRPTEMILSATAWPSGLRGSRSWGHGCLLELAWAFTTTRDNCFWECRLDEYLFQLRLVLTIGRNGEERTEELYHLPSCVSMHFAKSCAPPYDGEEAQLTPFLCFQVYDTSTSGMSCDGKRSKQLRAV